MNKIIGAQITKTNLYYGQWLILVNCYNRDVYLNTNDIQLNKI